MRTPGRADDEGTVLLLIIGLVAVVGLLVAVVTDVTALYLQRRDLVSAADGAALAGAQAVDEATIYTQGLPASGPLPLDEAAARVAVHEYLSDAGLDGRSLAVRVETTSTTVSVSLSTTYDLPVANTATLGVTGSAQVSASATARTAILP